MSYNEDSGSRVNQALDNVEEMVVSLESKLANVRGQCYRRAC